MTKIRRLFNSGKKSVEELKALAPKKDYTDEIMFSRLVLLVIEARALPIDSKPRIRKEDEIYNLFKLLSLTSSLNKLKEVVGEDRYYKYFAKALGNEDGY